MKFLDLDGLRYLWSKVTAKTIKYDNTNSGLSATNVAEGLDEVAGNALLTNSIIGYEGDTIPEGYEEYEETTKTGSSAPIGSGMDYYGTTAPENYMFADGSAISRTEYAELFEIIGTTYGAGDGSTTFNIPDKRERVSVMYKEGSSDFGTLGGKIGSSTNTLVAANLPAQSGSFSFHNWGAGTPLHSRSGVFTASVTSGKYRDGGTVVSSSESINAIYYSNGGSSTPFTNIQQSLVCNYIIKVK